MNPLAPSTTASRACRRGRLLSAATLLLAASAFLMPAVPAPAFTVVRNVNSGQPPVEKVVIFEKGKPADHLKLESTASGRTALTADGAIESVITGSDAVKIMIRWTPRGDLKAGFDTSAYTCLVITCRLEGAVKESQPNGKVVEKRPDNLWFGPTLFNAAGEAVGSANFADAVEDGKTPAETTTIRIPMVAFTFWGLDSHDVRAIGFTWGKTRANSNRDFRLVIDKIALAD